MSLLRLSDHDLYGLQFLPGHLVALGEWSRVERLLTNLRFLEAKAAAGMAHDLQEDFRHAVDHWPGGLGWSPFTLPPPGPPEPWLRECVQAALSGEESDLHPTLGAGPILAALRKLPEAERNPGTQEPLYPPDQPTPAACLGTDVGAAQALADRRCLRQFTTEHERVDPYLDTSPRGRVACFATFVQAAVHFLDQSPHEAAPLAYNYAPSGPVHEAAAASPRLSARGWLRRSRHGEDPPPTRPLVIRRLTGPAAEVRALALTPDGRTLVTGGEDGSLWVWDIVRGRCLHALQGHSEPVGGIAVTPDGKQAVSFTSGDEVAFRVWDLAGGVALRRSQGNRMAIEGLAASADGRLVLTVERDGTVRVWDAATGSCTRTISDPTYRPVGTPSLTDDGRLAVTRVEERRRAEPFPNLIAVWDVARGRIVRILSHRHMVSTAQITPDGKLVLAGDWDNVIRLWDVKTGACLREMPGVTDNLVVVVSPGDYINSLAVTPDGRTVASSGQWSRNIYFWDIEDGYIRNKATTTGASQGSPVAISADGRIAVSRVGADVVVWDVATGWPFSRAHSHPTPIRGVSLSSDGKSAYSFGTEADVFGWETETGRDTWHLEGGDGPVSEIACTAGDRTIIDLRGGTITFSNPATSQIRSTSIEADRTFSAVALPTDGIAVTADHHTAEEAPAALRLWDVTSATCLRTIDVDGTSISACSLTASGQRVMLTVSDTDGEGGKERRVLLYDLREGQCTHAFSMVGRSITAATALPDGCTVVTAEDDLSVRIWDLRGGQLLHSLWRQHGAIVDLIPSPTGRMVLSLSEDSTIGVWELASASCRFLLRGHRGKILTARVTPDGRLALSAGEDQTVRLWDLGSGECLSVYYVQAPIVGLTPVTPNGACVCAPAARELHFLQIAGADLGPPHVTARNRMDASPLPTESPGSSSAAGAGESDLILLCPWCREQFSLPLAVREVLTSLQDLVNRAPAIVPVALLPPTAWSDSRLLCQCPSCCGSIQVNPFLPPGAPAGSISRPVVCCSSPPRSAFAERVDMEEVVRGLDSATTSFVKVATGHAICPRCTRPECHPLRLYVLTPGGWVCATCILAFIRDQPLASDQLARASCLISDGLQEAASLSRKLFALTHFGALWNQASAADPTHAVELLPSLVAHLGLDRNQPADRLLRFLAVEACHKVGPAALPELLRRAPVARERSWTWYTNILFAARYINVEDERVRALFDQASQHPEPEVRHRVVIWLDKLSSPWVGAILQKMASDPVAAIRARVREVHARWQAAQPEPSPPSPLLQRPSLDPQQFQVLRSLNTGLRQLPRWAAVAFAARCAHRLVQHYMAWPAAPARHFGFLHRAAIHIECAAADATPSDDSFLREEVEDARRAAENVCAEAKIAGDGASLSDAEKGRRAARGLVAALNATTARGRAAGEGEFDLTAGDCAAAAAEALFFSSTSDTDHLRRERTLACGLLEDYQLLTDLATANAWTDDTPVSPTIFSPPPA